MGTNCAPLVADLFLFCYAGDFIIMIYTRSLMSRLGTSVT